MSSSCCWGFSLEWRLTEKKLDKSKWDVIVSRLQDECAQRVLLEISTQERDFG
jgi:hypothetical protein